MGLGAALGLGLNWAGVEGIVDSGTVANAAMVGKEVGDLFLRLLQMLVVPLIVSSLITGITGMGDLRTLGSIGGRAIVFYLTTSFLAILTGIFVVNIIIAGVLIRGAASFALVLLVLLMTSIGVTSLVVALSSRFSNQQEYASTIAFFNLLLFMTSGAFYPVIGIPGWLSWITVINPEYYAVHALRSIILRGQGITVIGTDLIALGIFSLGAIALGIMTYRRTLE